MKKGPVRHFGHPFKVYPIGLIRNPISTQLISIRVEIGHCSSHFIDEKIESQSYRIKKPKARQPCFRACTFDYTLQFL